ncbi:hypothetical protein OWR21_07350 [Ralstonia sp. 1B3]
MSRKPSVHAGLQQHAMLCACASSTRARASRAFDTVVRDDVRAARCASKKTMRRCDNAREFFALDTSIRTQSKRSTRVYRRVERVDDDADLHLERRRRALREVDAIAATNSVHAHAANRVPRIRCARWLRWDRSIDACMSATRIRACAMDVDASDADIGSRRCPTARTTSTAPRATLDRSPIAGKPCSATAENFTQLRLKRRCFATIEELFYGNPRAIFAATLSP